MCAFGKVGGRTSGDCLESVVGPAKDEIVGSSIDPLGCRGLCLIVAGAGHAGLAQAAANLPNVCVLGPEGLNVYDIVRAQLILILERELPRVKEVWS